jgi:hypothetical protein
MPDPNEKRAALGGGKSTTPADTHTTVVVALLLCCRGAAVQAAEYQDRFEELRQDFTASQQEIRSLQAAYKLLLADAASKTKQSTAQQNAAAGLRACLIRAQCKQAQLQETLAVYGDYISVADERIQQLEEALVTALEEVSLG